MVDDPFVHAPHLETRHRDFLHGGPAAFRSCDLSMA
jgi:hypothetical protein